MPLQTLLPFSLFRPFKNIRSILGEGGGRKFPSPHPARPHSHRKREKNKLKKKSQNTQRPQNPIRGKRSGDAPGRLGSPAGSPPGEGGREGAGGWEEVPGRSESPGGLPRSCRASSTQLSRSPAAPPAAARPGPPRGPLAGEEELEPCLHSPGCRSTEVGEKAGFHLAKNAQRRSGSSPSRPPRLLPRLPPRRIFPGRALREGYFFFSEAPLPTRAPRSPARPLQQPRDGAGRGGSPAGQNPRLPSLPPG